MRKIFHQPEKYDNDFTVRPSGRRDGAVDMKASGVMCADRRSSSGEGKERNGRTSVPREGVKHFNRG